jgi:hypothetical protein
MSERDYDRHNPYEGPYNAELNGECANGHPLNKQGRCEPLNETGVCETEAVNTDG